MDLHDFSGEKSYKVPQAEMIYLRNKGFQYDLA